MIRRGGVFNTSGRVQGMSADMKAAAHTGMHRRYAGDRLWSLKQDVTLSADQAGANVQAWMAAGGKFAAPPLSPPSST